MNNVCSFRYPALSSSTKQIRLLRVLEDVPAAFDCCCEMHNFDIELAPEYDAISYTWGSETPIKTILVNNGALQVRQNCWTALRQRGSLKTHLAWTWIDSICINQSDDEEKSGQVQMMADIYRRAGCVLISLPDSNGLAGQLSSNIAKAQALAPRDGKGLPRHYQPQDFHDKLLWDSWIRYLEGEYRGGLGDAKELRMFVDVLLDVALQPYWTRVWVIQELMLAKKKIILYGAHVIDWEPFMSVVRMAGDLGSVRPGQRSYDTFRRLDRAQLARLDDWLSQSMTDMVYSNTEQRQLYSLKSDLPKVLRLLCHDLRDRVYGLLSVIDWSSACGIPRVDYRKSRLELAVEVVELHKHVNLGSHFTLEGNILRALELQSDYNSEEVRTSLDVRISRASLETRLHFEQCACPHASISNIASAASRLVQGAVISVGTDRLCIDTWERHRLLLWLNDDKSAYVGYEFSEDAPSEVQPHISESCAFFSPNLQAGDTVICPFDSYVIPYMQRGNLILRTTAADYSEVVGVGVFNWPQDRIPSYSTFSLDLLFDVEDVLLLIIVLLGGANLDDWSEEDLHEAYIRLRGYRCRSRFSSFAVPSTVFQWTENQWNVPPICVSCGGSLMGKDLEQHCRQYDIAAGGNISVDEL